MSAEDRRDKPPVPALLGRIFEPFYRHAVGLRNRRFDAGHRVVTVPVPVISVGNLSVGGTGKTPMVMRLVGFLRDLGRAPGVAMRGYAAINGLCDEEAEYRVRIPDLPIIIDPVRVTGAHRLIAEHDVDVVILDDGFQHRFLHRDLEIVLVDAGRDPFRDHCLPRGWLREPVSALGRVDVLIITHADEVEETVIERLTDRARNINPSLIIATSAHAWTGLQVAREVRSPEWLAQRRLVVMCAIGHPAPVIEHADRAGAKVVRTIVRRDHHSWSGHDLAELQAVMKEHEGVEAVLTTEKDWVKLQRLPVETLGVPFVRPRLAMTFITGEDALLQRLGDCLHRPDPC